ncbi:MAG: DUF1841 family protein [Gammaproteobacteria bacterium]|nr:MAG: DUF1841 family protein [Gammaproteobacteria bacterium]
MLLSERDSARRFFLSVWDKHREGKLLEPLEAMVLDVVLMHPEYHPLLEEGEAVLERDWEIGEGVTNPFLHMGLHVALAEQVGADRPAGVTQIYRRLSRRLGDRHEAEHRMMGVLAGMLWEAQRSGLPPDEGDYLEALRRL